MADTDSDDEFDPKDWFNLNKPIKKLALRTYTRANESLVYNIKLRIYFDMFRRE